MMKLPTVAIIGRPNTGKSTLFNRLVGQRRAIVSPIAGTTRDPVASRVEGDKVDYLLIDTGGMGGGTEDTDFEDDVESQSLIALSHADLILFVVNGREELTAADFSIVDILRKKRKGHVSILLIVTKCDDPQITDSSLPRFYELSIAEKVLPVSAFHGMGIDELECSIEDALSALHFSKSEREDEENRPPKIAIVGRPNVGKSAIVNALMPDEERKIRGRLSGPKPGTTRDTTNTIVRHDDKEFLFLDTAGLRKHKNVDNPIEAYAVLRTMQAMELADITILVLDASQDIGRQEQRIAGLAIEHGTGLIFLVNKSDLLSEGQKSLFHQKLSREFPFCRWAPVLYTSALTRENLPKLFPLIDSVYENRKRRIATSALNRWFQDVVATYDSGGLAGSRAKAKYMTQVESSPPTFALFVNDVSKLKITSVRFVENKLREAYAFDGTPVRWIKKGREEE